VDVVLDFIAGCVSPVIPVLLVHWRHDMGERHLWYMGLGLYAIITPGCVPC